MEKEASLRTAGPEFENWKQPEIIKKVTCLIQIIMCQIINFHKPISAMRMGFGIVSAHRIEFSKKLS